MQAQPVAHGTHEMGDQVAFPRRGWLYLIQLRIAAPDAQGGFGAERRSKHREGFRRRAAPGLAPLLYLGKWRRAMGSVPGCQGSKPASTVFKWGGAASEKSMNLSLPVSSL